MNNRLFYGLIVALIIGSVIFIGTTKNKHQLPPRLGTAQADEANPRKHIAPGQKVTYSQPIPTSGPHGNEAPWGYSPQQLPNEAIIHNMEHGGVIISYRPDLDPSTVSKLVALFTKPYSDPNFTTSKAIVMPRNGQVEPIILSSWNRILKLNSYDQKTLENYYLTNVGKSPEPRGV